MSILDVVQVGIYLVTLAGLTPLLGAYCAAVMDKDTHVMTPLLGKIERVIYAFCGISTKKNMSWRQYAAAVLAVNVIGFLVLMGLQLFQKSIGLNPDHVGNVPWTLAFNTAASFVTNTNWQAYAGETTLSMATQLLGLTVQNFLSAATGIAVLIAFARAIRQKTTETIGNFWVDMTRSLLYILLPLSLAFALFLGVQGVVQTFSPALKVTTLQGQEQVIVRGPVASQEAIKQLGSNGGGYFNTNSAHPFENPTPLTNFVEMVLLLLLPSSLVIAFGKWVGNVKHAWVIWTVMAVVFVGGLSLSLYSESVHNPMIWEGKETRLGWVNSVIWSTATTAASNGSVNAMISSLSPLSGGVAVFNIMMGEVIFGGVGSGMYGMLLFILLTVFLAGLMVGRTPEYLSKKIEGYDIKWAMVAILLPNILILLGASVSLCFPFARASLLHAGPHGLSEMVYAFASCAGNNGSAFAGLNANTPYFNLTLGVVMLLGRFGVIVPCLAIAGNLSRKKRTPSSSGTFPVDGMLFGVLLLATLLIVGVLTFLPALWLGPISEHLLLTQHRFF